VIGNVGLSNVVSDSNKYSNYVDSSLKSIFNRI